MSPGDIIRVRDWPGTDPRERYVVKEVRDVPGSKYPKQVDAWLDETHGKRGAIRTFSADNCEPWDKKRKR